MMRLTLSSHPSLLTLGVLTILLLLCLPSSTEALYNYGKDEVLELTSQNFDQLVLKSKDVWVVEFFADWCGHCKQLAPEYKKAAIALKGVVKVGALDVDQHTAIGQRYGVQGFPTLKIFTPGSSTPMDYNGPRTAAGIAKSAMKSLNALVRGRLEGKKTGGSSSPGGSSGGGGGKVVKITAGNFEKEIMQSEVPVMIAFVAPWCGHCKNLKPNWKQAAQQMAGRVKFAQVDATVEASLAQRFEIRGYPTILFKPAGSTELKPYPSGRSTGDLVEFATSLGGSAAQEEAMAPPEVKQLLSPEQWDETCPEDKLSLCVFVPLPHILDSGAEGRKEYIGVLESLAKKLSSEPFQYLWAEAGQQAALEEALGLGGAGYPALAVVSRNKARYVPYMGAFSAENVGKFLRRVKLGREATIPFPAEVKIAAVEAWDGKDGEIPQDDHEEL